MSETAEAKRRRRARTHKALLVDNSRLRELLQLEVKRHRQEIEVWRAENHNLGKLIVELEKHKVDLKSELSFSRQHAEHLEGKIARLLTLLGAYQALQDGDLYVPISARMPNEERRWPSIAPK